MRHSSLTTLDLSLNGLRSQGVKLIAEALEGSCMAHVNLGQNGLGDEGAEALAGIFRSSCLLSLSLSGNGIGPRGAKILAGFLQTSSLQELALDGNSIGHTGALSVAAILPKTSLTKMNLYGNGIRAEGAQALTSTLRSSSLTWVDLGSNVLGAVGRQNLLDGLRASGLTRIAVKMHCPEAEREIEEVLEENRAQAQSFVLQMEVRTTATGFYLTFRTLSGDVAASLHWYNLQPAQELPAAVFSAMCQSGFRGFSPQDFRTSNLQIVLPSGWMVDVSATADPLDSQLPL